MMLLSICIIELGIIWMLCHINTELHNKKDYWERRFKHLKDKVSKIGNE